MREIVFLSIAISKRKIFKIFAVAYSMNSGNYLIGNHHTISMKTFDKYILPKLQEQELSIPDRIAVPTDRSPSILISVVGEGDIEARIDSALVKLGTELEAEEEELKRSGSRGNLPLASYAVRDYKYQFKDNKKTDTIYYGRFEVIGAYRRAETASELFHILALERLAGPAAEKVRDQFKELAENLADFGETLSGLSI